MRIGVPKEIKNHEYRVGLTPASVAELSAQGHEVWIETQAGAAIGFADENYREAGAQIAKGAGEVFQQAQLIVKVKEPLAVERAKLRAQHTLFTYLHLAPDRPQTEELMASGATCIAYETVTDALGRLPLLAPMSEVAGRMSIQAGAGCLEKARGGRGVLLGGVPGVAPGKVVILGGGVVGSHALAMAVGLGADVTVLDRNVDALRRLDAQYGNRITTLYSTRAALREQVLAADLVIGGVLIPGAAAPKLITADMVRQMKAGAVLVDVAIDQGGCAETSRATTHAEPTYVVDEVVHYCVANMPGAVARTSTQALNNATLPFVIALAQKGTHCALEEDPHLLAGLNVAGGVITCESVAQAHGLVFQPAASVIERLSR
ncbi:alanine dehydrogenase [Pseudomonas berkeleyensis]|uniref:Alanine dehydrogenase n=1 Tax=Pseudomonas berkeleyensis TaxID=2726956 RepID=A0A7G5DQD6_9PSED|nr:alanine dehydrogenase [Pseudomonas berkeleyensis]QMV63961.1 alanine dehydrogenase [Pseudomonas berkeleyensis]WSO39426.1 alanine dehydrogenase [Pseudomonas berkeleyensis]